MAFGDASGRICVSHLTDTSPSAAAAVSMAHWHSLGVRCLAWAADGEHLYSGGGEAVLVKWAVSDMKRVRKN